MGEVIQAQKKFLTAEEILGKSDFEFIEVDIPEWGGTIRFKALSADEAITFTEGVKGAFKNSAFVRIVALCAVDADGKRLFTDNQMGALRQKSVKVFKRLQDVLLKLNGFTDDEEQAPKND